MHFFHDIFLFTGNVNYIIVKLVLNSKRIRLKSAEANLSPSNVFKLRLGLSLTGHEFHDADKAANNMITINEHLGVIERL